MHSLCDNPAYLTSSLLRRRNANSRNNCRILSDDKVIIVGWLHFLAFDVLAGRYIWLRMLACDRPMYVSTPILVLGMMVAPLDS